MPALKCLTLFQIYCRYTVLKHIYTNRFQGEIQWREVPAGDTEFEIPVLSSQASQYIYGISSKNVETGVASQLFWARCLFKRYPSEYLLIVCDVWLSSRLFYVALLYLLDRVSFMIHFMTKAAEVKDLFHALIGHGGLVAIFLYTNRRSVVMWYTTRRSPSVSQDLFPGIQFRMWRPGRSFMFLFFFSIPSMKKDICWGFGVVVLQKNAKTVLDSQN